VRLLAATLLALCALFEMAPSASAETRTLKLYFVHTRERAEITYKENGRYLQGGLNQVNRFLRDWRRNEPTKMDPRLLDLLWEVYRASGSRDYIHVISAYRSPATNAMLRSRSRGVANKSQHMLGKAIDFYLPDVKLAKLRRVGLTMQAGGVGYYPSSGSPFVHLDVGSVRHWPRMSRSELMAMFPDGKTLHVPSDGKPLPGYQQALASYKRRSQSGGTVVASAEPRRSGGFLSAFFSGGEDRDEDDSESRATVAAASAAKPAPAAPEAAAPVPAESPLEAETPAMIIASLSDRSVPVPLFAPRPTAEVPVLADMPEAEAAASGEAIGEEVAELAPGVPVPTPRPEGPLDGVQTALVADAGGLDEARRILEGALADAGTAAGRGPVAETTPRPGDAQPAVVVAALPVDGPLVGSVSRADTRKGMAGKNDGKAEMAVRGERLSSETLRQHVLASLEASDGARVLDIGARTTAKAPKPVAADARGERRPRIIPLPKHVTRHAFDKAPIAETVISTKAPSFTFSPNNAAPREVYTAGFTTGAAKEDPNRFTGKAVTFLSVAKFN
jgi:uncharacterized protein YcbK (DUF882 family)